MDMLTLSTLFILVDWGQTRGIAINPDRRESNIILGRKPSTQRVDLYFTTVIIGNALISKNIPKLFNKKSDGIGYQRFYNQLISTMEFGYIQHNDSRGVKMNWRF